MKTEKVIQLSNEFSKIVNAEYSECELADVIALNRVEASEGVCHTHDYYDANEFMAQAFREVLGRDLVFYNSDEPETQAQYDSDVELWNAAWDMSKTNEFKV